jgi:hypothetical protein
MMTIPGEIPTPEEISRVTAYIQNQSQAAQDEILSRKRTENEAAEAHVRELITSGGLSGLEITRNAWDDTSLPWQRRGDITVVRMDFVDGTQLFVSPSSDGESLITEVVDPPPSPLTE